MGTELVDNAIKGVRVDTDFPPILIKVSSVPMVKEMELRCLLDGRVLVKNPCVGDFSA